MRSQLTALTLFLTLAACGVPPASSAPAQPASASVMPSPSPLPRTATATLGPAATAAPTDTLMPLPTQQARGRCEPGAESCVLEWPFPLQRPIQPPGTDQSDPAYRYGATQNGARDPHHGADLSNAFGTPVSAAADGTVVFAGSDAQEPVSPWRNFYGQAVVLEHSLPGVSEAVYTLYGHLSKVDVSVGEAVSAGDKIGEVGASGVALGSHLHFEVRLGTNDYASTRNPDLWLAPAAPLQPLPNSGLDTASTPTRPTYLSQGDAPRGGEKEGGVLAIRAVDSRGNPVPLTLDVQYYADPAGPPTKSFPVEAYNRREKFPVNSDDALGENFVLANLPPGRYRLSFVYWGALYERWVEVDPGKLTFTEFALK